MHDTGIFKSHDHPFHVAQDLVYLVVTLLFGQWWSAHASVQCGGDIMARLDACGGQKSGSKPANERSNPPFTIQYIQYKWSDRLAFGPNSKFSESPILLSAVYLSFPVGGVLSKDVPTRCKYAPNSMFSERPILLSAMVSTTCSSCLGHWAKIHCGNLSLQVSCCQATQTSTIHIQDEKWKIHCKYCIIFTVRMAT